MRKTLAVLTALLVAPASAQDIAGTSFEFGLWRGGAQADASGAFTHCYATLTYTAGEQIWINATKADQIEVILKFPTQSYRKDQTFEASLMLETGLPAHGTAQVIDTQLVSFVLAPAADAHSFLGQGTYLRLMGVGNDAAYEVRGLGAVVGMVRTCRDAQEK